MSRFIRQQAIPQLGPDSQPKLKNAHVIVIGAGGLGSPVITYLACAGIGKITIIDKDTVSLSNLNRQFLYGLSHLNKPKAPLAAAALSAQYDHIQLIPITAELTASNIQSLLSHAHVILDCVDNIKTRLLVNDFAISANIPLVEAGVDGFYGFLLTILPTTACLRCIGYDKLAQQHNIPALGSTCGVIGSLQVTECIKLILNVGKPMTNRILQYDGLTCEFDQIPLQKNCALHK